MPPVENYRTRLMTLQNWDEYLLGESRLPGARSNLELMAACADLASPQNLQRWMNLPVEDAPENTPGCFLVCCGVSGLGRLLCEGDLAWLPVLRQKASDPRWRVRESVCMALQRYGLCDMPALLNEMRQWAEGTFLEQRAAAAALCEPVLLKNPQHAVSVLQMLHRITQAIPALQNRRDDDFKTLRKALGYCWSVAASAQPAAGKQLMESWMGTRDADIRWIMKENLKKNRLMKMDPEWTRRHIAQLEE